MNVKLYLDKKNRNPSRGSVLHLVTVGGVLGDEAAAGGLLGLVLHPPLDVGGGDGLVAEPELHLDHRAVARLVDEPDADDGARLG